MTESRFRNLIERRGITFTDCNGALRAIALGVCDYLAETTGCPTQLARISLEGSIIGVVEDMFKEGLAHHGIAPVSMGHCWRPPRPGPVLEPRAAGLRPVIGSP